MATENTPQKTVRNWSRTILVAARVLMSVVGIAYFLAYSQKLDFVWFNQPSAQATALCWSLIAVLALRALGPGNWVFDRILSVLNLVLAQVLFSRTFPYSNVNEGLYLMLAFWCCFIQLNPPRDASVPAWAPILLGINVAISFHTSGISKLADPIWQEGTGFYHFVRLGWIRHPSADWLLDWHRALYVMNYVALFFEIGTLPLMLFRRTRPLACLMLLGFFISMIYPLRLDMIGQVGVCIVLVVLAGTVASLHEKQHAPGVSYVLAAYMVLAGGYALTGSWAYVSKGRLQSVCQTIHDRLNDLYPDSLKSVNEHTTILLPNTLFTSIHTLNQWAWRIVVKMPDGSTCEPVRMFNADRTPGPDTQAWGSTRHYQSVTYRISALARGDPEDYAPIDVLMFVAIKRCGGKYATLEVSPLDQEFTGWKQIKKYFPPRFAEPVAKPPQPALFVVGLIFLLAVGFALYPRYRRDQKLPYVDRNDESTIAPVEIR
jgi:hypothetical protein